MSMQKVNELKNNSKQIYGVPNGKKGTKTFNTPKQKERQRENTENVANVGIRRRLRVAYS